MRPEKASMMAQVGELLDSGGHGYLLTTRYQGLTVEQLTSLRAQLDKIQAELHVVKNTLLTRAARDRGLDALVPLVTGPTAVVVGRGDVSAAAKLIREFAQAARLPALTGGVLGRDVLSARDAEMLADLPPKPVLYARLLGVLQAPMSGLVGVLAASLRGLVNVLNAYQEKKAPAEG